MYGILVIVALAVTFRFLGLLSSVFGVVAVILWISGAAIAWYSMLDSQLLLLEILIVPLAFLATEMAFRL